MNGEFAYLESWSYGASQSQATLTSVNLNNLQIVNQQTVASSWAWILKATGGKLFLEAGWYDSGILVYDVPNRGNQPIMPRLNGAPDGGHPHHAGNGFLMHRGFTLVWSGWQGDVPGGADRLTASFPTIAGVTGVVREEFIAESTGLLGDTTKWRSPRSAFGSVRVRMPSAYWASTLSASISVGSVTVRLKEPSARSLRW